MSNVIELQNALAATPENWELRRQLVEALVAEGRHDSAVEVVNQGQELPHEPGPWLEAAYCYGAVGAIEQARGLVASSLQIGPEYAPALAYQQQLEAHVAATGAGDAMGAMEGDDGAHTAGEGGAPPPPTISMGGGEHSDEPMTLPKVSFSSDEMDALHAAEEEARLEKEATLKRDRLNSMIVTALILAAIFAILVSIATQVPPNGAPNVVARSAPAEVEQDIQTETLEKPTVEPTSAASEAVDAIVSNSDSAINLNNLDVEVTSFASQGAVSFNPSVSAGMPSSSASKMMFGQEVEGDTLGVILDVSGSMAEFLPLVLKEVDRNFDGAPIVYGRGFQMTTLSPQQIRSRQNNGIPPASVAGVALIKAEEVVRSKTRVVDGNTINRITPYSFLWNDLPKKAPQRYVDRLIESFKTRPNSFMRGGDGRPADNTHAVEFLTQQGVDAIYIFSDFEDPIEDELAGNVGQLLSRKKIPLYIQPAKRKTEHLKTMDLKVVRRSGGRVLPSLVSVLGGSGSDFEDSGISAADGDIEAENFAYATPQDPSVIESFGNRKLTKGRNNEFAHKVVQEKFDVALYKTRPAAEIFLKNEAGQYIQSPIGIRWLSAKYVPAPTKEKPDRMAQVERKLISVLEEPDYSSDELVWKIQLEQDVVFNFHVEVSPDEVEATMDVDLPKKSLKSFDRIQIVMLPLAKEQNDYFVGPDMTGNGITLKEVRLAARANTMTFNLGRDKQDKYAKEWERLGVKAGKNTFTMDALLRSYPPGVEKISYEGPSWGPRKIEIVSGNGNLGVRAQARLSDVEAWEGSVSTFHSEGKKSSVKVKIE